MFVTMVSMMSWFWSGGQMVVGWRDVLAPGLRLIDRRVLSGCPTHCPPWRLCRFIKIPLFRKFQLLNMQAAWRKCYLQMYKRR